MKLRNKKTGEIVDVESLGHAESLKKKNGYQVTLSWATEYENLAQCKDYDSLAELNEEWEDYKPAEPLIKDEKIRKAKTMGETIDDYQRKIYELIKRSYPEMVGYTADCHEYKTEDGQFGVHTALFMHRSEEEE